VRRIIATTTFGRCRGGVQMPTSAIVGKVIGCVLVCVAAVACDPRYAMVGSIAITSMNGGRARGGIWGASLEFEHERCSEGSHCNVAVGC
jgi:hypothetical protein